MRTGRAISFRHRCSAAVAGAWRQVGGAKGADAMLHHLSAGTMELHRSIVGMLQLGARPSLYRPMATEVHWIGHQDPLLWSGFSIMFYRRLDTFGSL